MEYMIGAGAALLVVWMGWVSHSVWKLQAESEVHTENAQRLADGVNAIGETLEPGEYDGDSEVGFHNG